MVSAHDILINIALLKELKNNSSKIMQHVKNINEI